MKKYFIFLKVALLLVFSIMVVKEMKAQDLSSIIKGHFNGSFENYSQYYLKDSAIGATLPPDRFGSNSFLKLDYNYDKFSAGVQFEAYLPPVLGFFPLPVKSQSKILNKYFKYTDKKFSIQVGDFYEQFGNGLIFRAYENRQIGINNAMEGANIFVAPTDFLKMKFIYGRTRSLFEYANSLSRGADAEVDLSKLFGSKNDDLNASIGGSYIGKFQEYSGPRDDFPTTVNSFAGRFDISNSDFSIDGEYVVKGEDPNLLNSYSADKGRALQINGSYTKNNLGVSVTLRSLYNMNFQNDRDEEFLSVAPLNFVPALTKQHDYLTSNIYVYSAQVKGETGMQADIYYNFSPGTALGGKYGTKVSANFSQYSGLGIDHKIISSGDEKYFSDANMEIKKKWNKKLETTIALQHIFYNSSVIRAVSDDDVNANVVAIGALYKWASKKSLRVKIEHLSTKTDDKNWASGLAEFSFSSPYQFFVSDLYNYGKTNIHYYNLGASVTKNATRFSLAFGKQRAGLFCVGGVCRFIPASYGFTATLTTSFAN